MSLNFKAYLARIKGADVVPRASGGHHGDLASEGLDGAGDRGFTLINLARPQQYEAWSAAQQSCIACCATI